MEDTGPYGTPQQEGGYPEGGGEILNYGHRVTYEDSPEARAASRLAHRVHHQRGPRKHPGKGRHPRKPGHGRHPGHHTRRIHRLHPIPHAMHVHHTGIQHGSVPSIHYKKHDPFHVKYSLRNKEERIARGLGKTLIPHGQMTLLLYVDLAIYREYGILVYNSDAPVKTHTYEHATRALTPSGPRVGPIHLPSGGLRPSHIAVNTHLEQDLSFSGVNSPAPHYSAPPAPHVLPVLHPTF